MYVSFLPLIPSSLWDADPVVWDSRTIHWNASPVGEQTRFVTYVCYCPKSMASEEVLKVKKKVFDERKGTTHWPVGSDPA